MSYKSFGYDNRLLGPQGPLSWLVSHLIEHVRTSRFDWQIKKNGYLVCTIEARTGNVSVANLASERESRICVRHAKLAGVEYDL